MKKAKERVIDLDKGQLKLLKEIIRRHVPDKIVWAYGSRVRWKAQDASDLDLVVFDCSTTEKVNLIEAFEESDLLVSVSVMAWEDIPEEFKEEIRGKYVVVQKKMRLEGWRKLTLREAAIINPPERISRGTEVKKVNMDALIPFERKISGYVREEFVAGTKFRNGDTLLARITPCLENGKTALVDFLESDEVGVGSTEFIVIREKVGVSDRNFLYYFSLYEEFRKVAIGSMTGTSGRQRVDINTIYQHEINLPPLSEQKAIAEILSRLDDKIDLLRSQNTTLEKLAQTLFRHRFIEGRNETWEKCVTGDLCSRLSSGGTPAKTNEEYYDGNINWFSTGELKDDFLFESRVKITQEGLINSSAKIFPKGTVIIAIYAAPTVGRLGILANDAAFNQAACGLVADERICCKEFLYLYLMHSRGDLNAMASGSAQQNLNVARIKNYPVFKPDEKTMREFQSTSSELFDKIEHNGYQIRNLRNLRDTLLPKLINGEVRVKSTSQNDEARFS